MYELVYVYDILLTWSAWSLLHKLIDKLHTTFVLKKLDTPQYFLGIEIHHQPCGVILLTQTKYIRDLLDKVNMTEDKGVTTPMCSVLKPRKHREDKLPDPFLYRSTIGVLQYVILTRSDISFCVNKACQYMVESHWSMVKRMLWYLSGISSHGLLLGLAHSMHKLLLRAYIDSNWTSDPNERHLTPGSCLFLGPNLVGWSFKKQSLVARSSIEAEYCALTHIPTEVLWIDSLL